jgi:hypothetical protein
VNQQAQLNALQAKKQVAAILGVRLKTHPVCFSDAIQTGRIWRAYNSDLLSSQSSWLSSCIASMATRGHAWREDTSRQQAAPKCTLCRNGKANYQH